MDDVNSSTALITGTTSTTSGIGEEIARKLTSRGSTVLLGARAARALQCVDRPTRRC